MSDLLAEQLAYYRARAGEYDDWWLRRGRYDRGPEASATWRAEAAEVEKALDAMAPHGAALELACGTGIWTARLAPHASSLLAVDGAPEALALAAARLRGEAHVRFESANLFDWRPPRRFDRVCFGFWLSHVPEERFDDFWGLVRDALAPGGQFFLVDSLHEATSTARDHALAPAAAGVQARRLADGRRFEVVKVYHAPEALTARLARLGFAAALRATPNYFLYGSGRVA
ncbi:MAG: class I SAM-dependent methyltransferase [Vicinamibacteria bacterium]|nr:class I SAM-dependent methyltransferase [Vicinamibacteria bacterium]